MNLSERKKKILQIVVDDYINTAVPVSSKSIAENHLKTISSATIRSELSALEELGYLSQLHTSSGRVPSPLAYKFYIEELMHKNILSPKELDYIKNEFTTKANDLEGIIKNVAKVISELTNYTSVAVANVTGKEYIDNIGLFRSKDNGALLLILTNLRLLKDNIIEIPKTMTDGDLISSANILNKLFYKKELNKIADIEEEVLKEFEEYKEVFYGVISALKIYGKQKQSEVMLEGENKIFEHPEYADINNVKSFLQVITSKEKLASILAEENDNIEINVKIGKESGDSIPKDCSLVSATYSAGGVKLGTYGVLGPVRMDYKKVITVLENVGQVLESIINGK